MNPKRVVEMLVMNRECSTKWVGTDVRFAFFFFGPLQPTALFRVKGINDAMTIRPWSKATSRFLFAAALGSCLWVSVVRASVEVDPRKFDDALAAADAAWQRGDWDGVRGALAPVIADPALPVQRRSIARLRSARSLIAAECYD